ncbi:hypothetical protein, partial [Bradyrhizobium sp. NBAIM08]|uniref:hypothetical protein n=1 Tax=Bradyrhizobium sp. NBAIM08 TaxID=2793815 RepID=UPI001CD42A05
MSTNTWTQYVAMDDAALEPGLLQSALNNIEDWDDDFDLGEEPDLDDLDDLRLEQALERRFDVVGQL